jgi:hypothetical protein
VLLNKVAQFCIASEGDTMEWTKPEFIEVNMDTEIGRYQEDPVGL